MWETHLYQAERHVALGERHVARQLEIIAELESNGHDAIDAHSFLRQLKDLLGLHVAYRDRLRQEIGP